MEILQIKFSTNWDCTREVGRPAFNRTYLEFATHYRFQPLTIERPFYYLERNFLNGRKFRDMEDLKRQLQEWLNEVNDLRIHGTTKKRPIELIVYSPDGEQLAVHPLAQKGQKGRYVGVHQKKYKKPHLPISDVVSRLESFAPEKTAGLKNKLPYYRVYEAGDIEGFLKNNSEPRYSVRLSIKPRNNSNNDEY